MHISNGWPPVKNLKFLLGIIKIFLAEKNIYKFILGVLISFSFSIAVILSTIGIMDGFEESLIIGLRKSSGDVNLYNRYGFFNLKFSTKKALEENSFENYSPYIQLEGFLLKEGGTKGIQVKGIELESYQNITGLNFSDLEKENHVLLGSELYEEFAVEKGDKLTLVLSDTVEGKRKGSQLVNLFVSGKVHHGVYQKDLRSIYVKRTYLSRILNIGQQYNYVTINLEKHVSENSFGGTYINQVRELIRNFPAVLESGFVLRPFWSEYSHLLKAVQVEKYTIILILQVIVVVSIFNVLAFMIYLNERKSQQLFLLQAMGLSRKYVVKIWIAIIFGLWGLSCFVSIFMTQFFDYLLRTLPIFSLPGDVYAVKSIYLKISPGHYIFVFAAALAWLALILGFAIYRTSRASLLSRLRKEFA